MAIRLIRDPKNTYIQIDKNLINDPLLTLEELGLMMKIIANEPYDWKGEFPELIKSLKSKKFIWIEDEV